MRHIRQDGGWHCGAFSLPEIAEALGEDATSLDDLLRCGVLEPLYRKEVSHAECRIDLSSAKRANLAIVHALWRQAGLAPVVAARVLSCWPQIGASVARIVDFTHMPAADEERSRPVESEPDPFMFFDPIATEAIPVAVVDEYLDLIDERVLLWRRPEATPETIAAALVAGSKRLSAEPSTLEEEANFLSALARLRQPVSHSRTWLGTLDGETFRPTPSRDASNERLRGRVHEIPIPPEASLEMNYRTKISINISLAARVMKRRSLGLAVSFPGKRA